MSLSMITIPADRYDDLAECWDFAEAFDCLLQHRYAALGSFAAVMKEIGEAMDWNVQEYERSGKPWDGPTHMLNNVLDVYDVDQGVCS